MNGFIYQHSKDLAPVTVTHPYSLEISVLRQTDGSRYWHTAYNMPKTGITVGVTDYGSI